MVALLKKGPRKLVWGAGPAHSFCSSLFVGWRNIGS